MKTKLTVIFSLLIFVAPTMLRAETPLADTAQVSATQALPEVGTYDQLVAAIRKARAASQARVEQAVQQEKVRECWETGKLIDEHVLQHKERADYGAQVLERLSTDLGTSRTELSYMLQFARAYPIFPAPEKSGKRGRIEAYRKARCDLFPSLLRDVQGPELHNPLFPYAGARARQ